MYLSHIRTSNKIILAQGIKFLDEIQQLQIFGEGECISEGLLIKNDLKLDA